MKRLNAPYYLSAYGIARQNGFEGTEEDWLLSLKGEPGPQGERGPQGVRGLTGERGPAGKNGWTYVPSVNAEGYMLWNTVISAEGLPETLPAVNIRGPQGPQGPAYELTEKDKNLIAESVMAMLDVKEPEEPNQSVEGAGGSADWSQNSEDGAGYIKNRPFYDYEIDELPLTETMLSDGSAELAGGFMLIGGAEYKVSFNGQSYVCTAVDFSSLGGIIFLGNDNLMGNESSRTEPFCIVSSFDTSSSTLMVSDASAYSCSIAVTRLEAQKIPQRFMPWSPHTGNTLYWDGSIIDSDVTVVPGDTGGQIFIKVSDIVPTEEELKEGITLTEYVDGSEICTYVPGPVTYSSDGTIWLGVLLPTAVIVSTPSQDGALTEGIYFIVTKAELGAGLMEFRAGAMSVHALHRFTSCPTLHGSAMPKYLDTLCVDRIVFRSPLGRLYALSVSDNGATVFKEAGTVQQ